MYEGWTLFSSQPVVCLIYRIEYKVGKVGLQVQHCTFFQETDGHISLFSKQMVWVGTWLEDGNFLNPHISRNLSQSQ